MKTGDGYLKHCQANMHQFSTLRQAKHSSLMVRVCSTVLGSTTYFSVL